MTHALPLRARYVISTTRLRHDPQTLLLLYKDEMYLRHGKETISMNYPISVFLLLISSLTFARQKLSILMTHALPKARHVISTTRLRHDPQTLLLLYKDQMYCIAGTAKKQ